jgi:Spy/CpxP family protein refolding chaperone
MKKIITAMALLIITGAAVHAQDSSRIAKKPHHQHARHHGQHSFAKLQLSDQQKQQMKAMNTDYHTKMADLKKQDDITVKEFRTRMHALRSEHQQQFQSLLTTQQKDQLAKMKTERSQSAKANGDNRAAKMKARLGLTDTQASQLKTAREDMRTKMKSIHGDSTLTREQKHEQVKALALQQKEQLKTILSDEQIQQLQQMKPGHHRREFSK